LSFNLVAQKSGSNVDFCFFQRVAVLISSILPLIGSYCFNQSILLLNVIPVSDKSSQRSILPPMFGAIELISLEKTISPCSSSTPFPLYDSTAKYAHFNLNILLNTSIIGAAPLIIPINMSGL
jgi:hypothetical protein